MELSRPEYWSGQPFPSPGDLPNPGIKPRFPALQVDSLPAELPGKPTTKVFLKVLSSVGPFKDVTAFWVVIFYHKEIIYMSAIFE